MTQAERAGGEEGSIPVFVNRRAGYSGAQSDAPVAEALRRVGVEARIVEVHPAELGPAVARAARDGAAAVGVGGGDGSLLTAAGVLAGGDVPLAPLPMGTLNHFARRLGSPDLRSAAEAIVGGRAWRVPVGVVDDRIFLNTATFGVYADVVRRRERMRRWLTKWPAAAVAIVATLMRMRRMEVVLEVDGRLLRRTTCLVWVGVGWGSFPRVHEAPERRASPDLEIVILRAGGAAAVLALLFRLPFKARGRTRPVDDSALEIVHARSFLIRAHRRIGVTLDGEVTRLRAPLFVAVQDDALPVLVPPDRAPAGTPAPAQRAAPR